MKVDIQLPESIGRQLEHEWHDVPRRALEAIAVEASVRVRSAVSKSVICSGCHFGKRKLSSSNTRPISHTTPQISKKTEPR